MYFATDPVALGNVGWKVVYATPAEAGMLPVATAKPGADSNFLNMQVEHIEIAGALGLGVLKTKDRGLRAERYLNRGGAAISPR